ncbi:MAG: hemolysin family protein [Candidatus Omnitrophica bacterium]|nr:hemolysin family protein [Candidatus Omnitrophota bacterium]
MGHTVSLPAILILLFVLTVISFFLSASETSIIGLSKIRLRHMLARGIKRAQSVQRLMNKLDKFIIALLVGNNFVNIAISAIVTAISVFVFGYKWGIVIATFATSFFIVIICEIVPKILAIKHTEKVALFISPFMEAFIKLFTPLTAIFDSLSNVLTKLFRIKPAKRSPLITEEELRLMIELGKEEGFLSDEEGKMLQRIFEFGDTTVTDVMVPKGKIVAVNKNATSEDLLNIFVEQGHERLPVYDGSVDNIIGIIYAHDLLYILRDKGLFLLEDLIHEAYYVSSQMRVTELLKKFQSDKLQIAVVVDTNKKTLGLVTLEDLTEEIVGEIEERHVSHHAKKN